MGVQEGDPEEIRMNAGSCLVLQTCGSIKEISAFPTSQGSQDMESTKASIIRLMEKENTVYTHNAIL